MQTWRGLLTTGWHIVTQKWDQRHLPETSQVAGDVSGQTIVITGPTSGVGEQLAIQIAAKNAHLILACRSLDRGRALEERLERMAESRGQKRPRIEVLELDVGDLASVRRFAAAWLAAGRGIHSLINNAGIFAIRSARQSTKDGFEAHMATNYLGPFLLTALLLPALQQAGSAASPARVVMVTSNLHYCCGGINRGDPNLAGPGAFSPLRAYSQSKFALVALAAEMRRRLPLDGSITVFACNPGECHTNIVRDVPAWVKFLQRLLVRPLLLTSERGSLSSLHCATRNPVAAELQHTDPQAAYIGCDCEVGRPASAAVAPEEGRWLWGWSCATAGVNSEIASLLDARTTL